MTDSVTLLIALRVHRVAVPPARVPRSLDLNREGGQGDHPDPGHAQSNHLARRFVDREDRAVRLPRERDALGRARVDMQHGVHRQLGSSPSAAPGRGGI